MIKKLVLAWNVYSYFFIANFWLKNGMHTKEYKIGASLTILIISNFTWIYFLYNLYAFNWRAVLFFICFFHITLSLCFLEDIETIVEQPKTKRFNDCYLVFLGYLFISAILFLLMCFGIIKFADNHLSTT